MRTRAAVLAAAGRLFGERGWTSTGIRDIAQVAGVSVETVYANFGSKSELLMAALDVSVVGDAEPVALADRAEFRAIAQGPVEQRVFAAAHLITKIHQSTAGLHAALRQGASGEPELARRLSEGEARRRVNIEQGAQLVAGRPVSSDEVDSLWAISSVDVFHLLTVMRGWSAERYEQWIADELRLRLPVSGQ